MSLIAEIKHHPPEATSLATAVAEQALTYALAGNTVIAVLMVPPWFKDLSITCSWSGSICQGF